MDTPKKHAIKGIIHSGTTSERWLHWKDADGKLHFLARFKYARTASRASEFVTMLEATFGPGQLGLKAYVEAREATRRTPLELVDPGRWAAVAA